MNTYRGFPQRLHHRVPHWVEPGALFHIRIALDRGKEQTALTELTLGRAILDSAKFYEGKMRWHITLFLLMPDHLHALLSFALDESMSDVIRDWKRFHTRSKGVTWQEGYFDHRMRADERGTQLSAKMNYIRQNPVVAGLCAKGARLAMGYRSICTLRRIDFSSKCQPGSESMAIDSLQAQILSGGNAAFLTQRVEDNAFHRLARLHPTEKP